MPPKPAVKHTKASEKLQDFLEAHPDTWHKISEKEINAFTLLQEMYGPLKMEFDGFTNQMRYSPLAKTQPAAPSHTPTPWKVSEVTKDNSEFQALIGNQEEGWIVGGIYRHPKLQFNGKEHVHVNTADRKARALADAAFIVTACNAYEQNQQTIKDLVSTIDRLMIRADLTKQESDGIIALLAKAEGR